MHTVLHNSKTLHKFKDFNGGKVFQMERNISNGEKPFEWRETFRMERNPFNGEKPFDWRETF